LRGSPQGQYGGLYQPRPPEQQSGPGAPPRPPICSSASRTAVINAIRAHLAEFRDRCAGSGRHGVEELLTVVARSKRPASSGDSSCVSPGIRRPNCAGSRRQILEFRPADQGLAPIQRDEHEARRSPRARSGAGYLLWSLPLLIQSPSDQGATSRPGSVLCRKQHSSGGKNRLGNISKQGDRYLRGACSWPARLL